MVEFAHIHHRQVIGGGDVESFVEHALMGGAIAEEGQRDSAVFLVLGAERGAGGQRDARTHDAVGAQDTQVGVSDVHGAALALVGTGGLAVQLRHHGLGVHALGDAVAVAAVGAGDVVIGIQRRAAANRHRFLTQTQVQETGNGAGAR